MSAGRPGSDGTGRIPVTVSPQTVLSGVGPVNRGPRPGLSAVLTGRGRPEPDTAVIPPDPPRNLLVGVRRLQRAHRPGKDGDNLVPVPDRCTRGLHPRHPRVPGTIPLVLLPAQQVRDDPVPDLDQRRRPRHLAEHRPGAVSLSHATSMRTRIRHVQDGLAGGPPVRAGMPPRRSRGRGWSRSVPARAGSAWRAAR